MVIDIDKAMEHSFVLTNETSQYGLFCKRLQSAGFKNMPLEYFQRTPRCVIDEGCRDMRLKSISQTHYHIINMANTLGLDYVTIFEWDAYPMTDCRDRLVEFFADNPPPDDSTCIALGNTRWIKNDGSFIKGSIGRYVRPLQLFGSHAVIYPKSGYANWLSGYRSVPDDHLCFVDHYHSIHPNCYVTDQSFFIQVKDRPQWWVGDGRDFSDFAGLDPLTGYARDFDEYRAGR